jgi:hypothetical protein
MGKHQRPRLSSIEQLPDECGGVIAWAAQELAKRDASLTDIYGEFRRKLIALQGELGLGFDIPSFSAFGRHSIREGNLRGRTARALLLSKSLNENVDGKDADELTKAATLTLKTLIFEMVEGAGEAGFEPKEAMAMASAMRQLQQAENLSTARRLKLDEEFAAKAEKVIDQLGKEKGMSTETIAQLRHQFLGVRKKETS